MLLFILPVFLFRNTLIDLEDELKKDNTLFKTFINVVSCMFGIRGHKMILVTELMCDIFQIVHHNESNESYLIVGPPRIGKTTALLWLYLHLRSREQSQGNNYYFIAQLNSTILEQVELRLQDLNTDSDFVHFFCDLNQALAADSNIISSLDSVIARIHQFERHSCVFSASSAFLLAMYQRQNSILRSFASHLYTRSTIIEAKFTKMESTVLIQNFLPSSTDDDDVLNRVNNIPGFIYDFWKSRSKDEAYDKISHSKYKSWVEIFPFLNSNPFFNAGTVQLLVCLCHGISLFPFMEREEAISLPPVTGHLIGINYDGVPYDRIGFSNIKSILEVLDTSHLKTEEGSALGFLFEPIICKLFESPDTQVEMFYTKFLLVENGTSSRTQTPKYTSKVVGTTTFPLCMAVLRRTEDLAQRDGQLWMTTKSFPAIDAFVVKDNCLWLVQVTVNENSSVNQNKIRKFKTLPQTVHQCILQKNIQEVIFVYINIHGVEEVSTLASLWASVVSNISFNYVAPQPKMSLAIPEDCSKFQRKYLELKTLLSL